MGQRGFLLANAPNWNFKKVPDNTLSSAYGKLQTNEVVRQLSFIKRTMIALPPIGFQRYYLENARTIQMGSYQIGFTFVRTYYMQYAYIYTNMCLCLYICECGSNELAYVNVMIFYIIVLEGYLARGLTVIYDTWGISCVKCLIDFLLMSRKVVRD